MKPIVTQYARDEQHAHNWVDEYVSDKHQQEGTCNCGCGQTKCIDIFYGVNENPELRIIVCESCFITAALHDRL